MKSTRKINNIEEHFWSLVRKGNKCWEYIGYCKKGGYGQFYVKRKPVYAHRFSYFLTYGEIPDGLNILHRCDNPRCVKPQHLFIGTQKDNILDSSMKGRRDRKYCKKGHKFDKISKRGGKICSICRREYNREYHRKLMKERRVTK